MLALKVMIAAHNVGDSDDEVFSTLAWIATLLDQEPGLSVQQLKLIEEMCRKVDVAKVVRRSYGKDLKSVVHETPVPDDVYPALIMVFVRAARQTFDEQSELHLKFMNSAANALDIYISQQQTFAVSVLESIVHSEMSRH